MFKATMTSQNNQSATDGAKRKRKHSGSREHESPKKVRSMAFVEIGGDEGQQGGNEIDRALGDDAEPSPKGRRDNSVAVSSLNLNDDISGSVYHSENEEFWDDSQLGSDNEETIKVLEKNMKEIQVARQMLRQGHDLIGQGRKGRMDAIDTLSLLEKDLILAQMQKNAFCSLKRSKVRDFFPRFFDELHHVIAFPCSS
jgi:hypothetical protein